MSDPGLGNAALFQLLFEHESEPPAGRILSTDVPLADVAEPSAPQHQQEMSPAPMDQTMGGQQQMAISASKERNAVFWYYRPQITLAFFELELRAHHAEIVLSATAGDAPVAGSGADRTHLSEKEFELLIQFIQQVCFNCCRILSRWLNSIDSD